MHSDEDDAETALQQAQQKQQVQQQEARAQLLRNRQFSGSPSLCAAQTAAAAAQLLQDRQFSGSPNLYVAQSSAAAQQLRDRPFPASPSLSAAQSTAASAQLLRERLQYSGSPILCSPSTSPSTAAAQRLRDRQQFSGSPTLSAAQIAAAPQTAGSTQPAPTAAHPTPAAPASASSSTAPIQPSPLSVSRPVLAPARASSCDIGSFCGGTHAPEMRVQLPMYARSKSGCEMKLSQARRQAVMVQQRIQQQQAQHPNKRARYDMPSPASSIFPTAHAVPLIPSPAGGGQMVPDGIGTGHLSHGCRPQAIVTHAQQLQHPQDGHVMRRVAPAGVRPHGRGTNGHVQHMQMQPQYVIGSPAATVLAPAGCGGQAQHYVMHAAALGDAARDMSRDMSRDVSNGYPAGRQLPSATPDQRAAQATYTHDGTPYAYVSGTARAYSCGMAQPADVATPVYVSSGQRPGNSALRPMATSVQAIQCDNGQAMGHGSQQRRPPHPQHQQCQRPPPQAYQCYEAQPQPQPYQPHMQQPQRIYERLDGSAHPGPFPNSQQFPSSGPPPVSEPAMACAVAQLPASDFPSLPPLRGQGPPYLNGRALSNEGRGLSSFISPGLSSVISSGLSSVIPPGLSSVISPGLSSFISPGLSSVISPGLSSNISPGLSSVIPPGLSSVISPGLSSVIPPGLPSVVASAEGQMVSPRVHATGGRRPPPPPVSRQGSGARSIDSSGSADAEPWIHGPHAQLCGGPHPSSCGGPHSQGCAALPPLQGCAISSVDGGPGAAPPHPAAENYCPDNPNADDAGGSGTLTEDSVASLVERVINNRHRRHCTIDAHLDEIGEI
jgi:hypothetical protein